MPAFSLLAPVPLEHLLDAVEICRTEGKVAFGSRAWEVFRKLDIGRNGAPVNVYIYASGDFGSAKTEISWRGRYIGHVEGKNGVHPDGLRFRPSSTTKSSTDNEGYWAVFWELDQLSQLDPGERIPTSALIGHKSGKRYAKNFIPKGPLIVAYKA